MESWLAVLSPDLFWDVSLGSIDPQKNLRWLVERILVRGRWEDWLELKRHVSPQDLEELLPRLMVPPRERNFLKIQLESVRA